MKERVELELKVVKRVIEKTENEIANETDRQMISLNKAYLYGYRYTQDVLENILKEGEEDERFNSKTK